MPAGPAPDVGGSPATRDPAGGEARVAGNLRAGPRAQPLGYAVWMEYIKALEATPGTSPAEWLDLARRAVPHVRRAPGGRLGLVLRCFGHVSPTQSPAQRAAFLLECHAVLNQKTSPKMYAGILRWAAS